MSKERLEEVKHFVDLINFIPRDSRGMGEMDVVNVQEDMQWLIEQAERVQELEEDLLELVKQNKELRKSIAFYSSESYNAHLERLLDRSEKQTKRYREALEFYAEGKHVAYKLDETDDDLVVDYGETARKALEGEE